MPRRYLPFVTIFAAALVGVGYWVWSTPSDPAGGRGIVAVASSRSGRWFAAATASGRIGIWDRKNLDAPQYILANQGTINDLEFSPDEQFLGVANRNLTLYPVARLGSARELRKDQRNYGVVRFDATGTSILTVTGASSIERINTATGVVQLAWCCSTIYGEVAFTPDGKRVASAGHWPSLWNASTGELIARFTKEREIETLRPIHFDGRLNLIFMGSQDGSIYGWDLTTGKLVLKSPEQSGYVDNMTRMRSSNWIAYSRVAQEIHLWNPTTNQTKPLTGAIATSNLAPGAEPQSLLFGNYAGSVELWNIETGQLLQRVTLR